MGADVPLPNIVITARGMGKHTKSSSMISPIPRDVVLRTSPLATGECTGGQSAIEFILCRIDSPGRTGTLPRRARRGPDAGSPRRGVDLHSFFADSSFRSAVISRPQHLFRSLLRRFSHRPGRSLAVAFAVIFPESSRQPSRSCP